jgi:hypothetical protein
LEWLSPLIAAAVIIKLTNIQLHDIVVTMTISTSETPKLRPTTVALRPLHFSSENSGKQRRISEPLAVLPFVKSAAAEDFRQTRSARRCYFSAETAKTAKSNRRPRERLSIRYF